MAYVPVREILDSKQNPIVDGDTTADQRLTVNGTAPNNASVTILVNNEPFGPTPATGQGNWSYDLVLTTWGRQDFIAYEGTEVPPKPYVITTRPALAIEGIYVGEDLQLLIPDGGETDATTVYVVGAAPALSWVLVNRNDANIGNAQADSSNSWIFRVITLSVGPNRFKAVSGGSESGEYVITKT